MKYKEGYKPILFNTEMVKAILEGRKTETRRPIKNLGNSLHIDKLLCDWALSEEPFIKGSFLFWELQTDVDASRLFKDKLKYQVGDILYVREAWTHTCIGCKLDKGYCSKCGTCPEYFYKADGLENIKWRPSIHMPKEAARIFLKVTDVKVERLQDITEEGIRAEGISWKKVIQFMQERFIYSEREFPKYERKLFKNIWDSIYSKKGYGWDKNPFGFVYKFERSESK